ncbi:MAG: aspartate--ammonia ligase [Deltaproteobacteria bacterium]|nr:aspartate--ammonia ligase [Deltaproteobacteria bacterium]
MKANTLSLLETEQAIYEIKTDFQQRLAEKLNLYRVTAPLFIDNSLGIQDNLNGFENPVSFKISTIPDREYEIVHSLAKWKRMALARYKIDPGLGLYTDMNALRPDEENLLTGIHSVYVDQWDWELSMHDNERNYDFLIDTVRKIYDCIRECEKQVCSDFGLRPFLPGKIEFVHSEELLERWPGLTAKEREDKACKEYGAVFITGIGGKLADGTLHDGRAPDYDDWTSPGHLGRKGLNGDILVWNPVLKRAFEVSSMGIRVNPQILVEQLKIRNCEDRLKYPWHQMLVKDELPQSIGGGIGQSRLCMLLLQKKHIGEVQAGVWPDKVLLDADELGLVLL